MVYLFESELKENKLVSLALTDIFGIGKSTSFLICKKLGFSKNLKINNLSKEQISKLLKNIDSSNILISSDLKKRNSLKLKELINIKSYRGLRRFQGLPVRGQRTHTNAKTASKRKQVF